MSPLTVRYTGAAFDYSGYGEAVRHDIAALLAAGIEVTVEPIRHCLEIADFGELGKLVQSKVNNPVPYKVKIIHTTPNLFPQYIEQGVYNIGRVFWETDKLPPDFARGAECCDEIWTGSKYNYDAIRNAGVTKPIFIIPEVITTNIPEHKPYMADNVGKNVGNSRQYNFYSIFEWTERKNPEALLTAYWQEFEGNDKVSLTLKTYLDNFTPEKKVEIDSRIRQIKIKLGLKHYAPLYLYRNLMDRHQIYRFHATFDCFVSAHRGEGWGIPQMEAMLLEKPIISTNCGGIHEYLNDEIAMCIPYISTPVRNNNRNTQWYCEDQNWAEVNIDQLRSRMRWTCEHKRKAKEMGKKAAQFVKKTFSPESVGKMMRAKLEVISLP